jgi:hypothetical protein
VNRILLLLLVVAAPLSAQGTSTGLVPLTDLGTGTYNGYAGGLYPGGANAMPAAHMQAGQGIAQSLQPLNASGAPAATGKIVIASLGMCNTTTESQFFLPLIAADSAVSPKVKFVDGAEGGMTADKLGDPNHAEHQTMWGLFDSDIQAQGVTGAQVQVVWLKITTAWAAVPAPKTFPQSAQWLQGLVRQTVLILKQRYPSVKVVYLTSRVYAGYATTQLNPEPYAYENGFSLKWLIEQQINGDASLAFNGTGAPAPWIAWGPYMWTDGLGSDGVVGGVPGRSDGLEWMLSDMANDGTHPSQPQGATKVAQLLLDFFKADTIAAMWFLAAGAPATLSISTATLPGATSGELYGATLMAVSGGATAPYNWSLASGTLPPGLSLDIAATGLSTSIDGNPTTEGTWTFVVQVSDSSATPSTATRGYTIVVGSPSSGAGSGGGDSGGCTVQDAAAFLCTLFAVLPAVALVARRRRGTGTA